MRPTDKIKKLIGQLQNRTSAELDERTLKDVFSAMEKLTKTQPALKQPNIWRIIMKNPITKLAAAAIIIVAVSLAVNIFHNTIPTASAAQVFAQAIKVTENLESVRIKALMRTRPNDNFASIQLDHDFIPLMMWKHIDDKGLLRWRIEKSDRVAVMDGGLATLLIRNSWISQGNCPDFWCFDLHWLGQLLNINGLLESVLTNIKLQKDMELSMQQKDIDGRDLLVIEIYSPAKGDFTNDYMKNKFISTSDHTCVYYFDHKTKFLEGFDIYVHTEKNDVLIFEITDINYNKQIDDDLFVLDLPENAIWLDRHPEILADNERYGKMTPKETAEAFFKAFADQNWEEAAKFWELSKDTRVREIYGGLEMISIGESFQSGSFKSWFVPYEIKLKTGQIKKHNLALKKDKHANRYFIDGGL